MPMEPITEKEKRKRKETKGGRQRKKEKRKEKKPCTEHWRFMEVIEKRWRFWIKCVNGKRSPRV